MRWTIAFIAVGAIGQAALAAPPPTTQATTQGAVFDIPGMHGTAAEIDHQVHAELIQIKQQIADAQDAIRDVDKEMADQRARIVPKISKDFEEYGYVCDTITEVHIQLDQATAPATQKDLQNKIAGFEKRKSHIEDDALAADPGTPPIAAKRDQRKKELADILAGQKKALDWRSEVASAVRGSYQIQGPLVEGSEGVIGPCTIEKVNDGMVTAEVKVFTAVKKEPGDREGILTVRGHYSDVLFVFDSPECDKLHAGESLYLVDNVRVDHVELAAGMKVATAKHVGSDVEALIHAFDDFPDPKLPEAKTKDTPAP